MTQPILTIQCTDARPDFMGEEIMPGYFRVTGSSDPVLQSLITARPEFNVRFKWGDGDLAMWDNRQTLHRGPKDVINTESSCLGRWPRSRSSTVSRSWCEFM